MKNGVININISKPKARELIKKLRSVFDDKEFVLGVSSYLSSDKDAQIIIDYIDEVEDVTSEKVILLAMTIDDKNKEIDSIEDDDWIIDDFAIMKNNAIRK